MRGPPRSGLGASLASGLGPGGIFRATGNGRWGQEVGIQPSLILLRDSITILAKAFYAHYHPFQILNMKVVLSGSTGYIGSEILTQCLTHPSITSLLLLTRRPPSVDLAAHPKAKVLILEDFTSYSEATLSELKSADAAIWCLGTYTGNEKVDIEYPLAFIEIIKTQRPAGSRPFRYVQLGGAFTEPPPEEGEGERSLWFYKNGRRVRGAAEARVLAAAEDDGGESGFAVYVVKPGGVLPKDKGFFQWILGDSLSIRIDELGATMVDLAVHGNENEERVFSNQEIIRHARKLLEKSS